MAYDWIQVSSPLAYSASSATVLQGLRGSELTNSKVVVPVMCPSHNSLLSLLCTLQVCSMGGSSWNCELPAGPGISCTITSFTNMVLCASDGVQHWTDLDIRNLTEKITKISDVPFVCNLFSMWSVKIYTLEAQWCSACWHTSWISWPDMLQCDSLVLMECQTSFCIHICDSLMLKSMTVGTTVVFKNESFFYQVLSLFILESQWLQITSSQMAGILRCNFLQITFIGKVKGYCGIKSTITPTNTCAHQRMPGIVRWYAASNQFKLLWPLNSSFMCSYGDTIQSSQMKGRKKYS